jgi:hypothetical protein
MSTLPRSHQEIVEQLDLMLRARYPLIYIVGAEEEPSDFLSAIDIRAEMEFRAHS